MRISFWTVPKASLLPAIIMAGLVVFTFSTLQNYGPESALRKFHASLHNIFTSLNNRKGISENDWAVLRSTLSPDIGPLIKNPQGANVQPIDPSDNQVVSLVLNQFRANSTYSLARMDRYPQEVRIAVIYSPPNQPPTCIVWVVDKVSEREWRVDAQKTLSAMSRNMP